MTARACELVVFDWDGTLMDPAARIVAAVQAATAASGLEPRTDAEIREIIGPGMEKRRRAPLPRNAGARRTGLRRDPAQAGMEHRFVATRTADEFGSRPGSRMLHGLLAQLGVGPGAALMVGDTLFDLEMARHAGVPAVAVSWRVHGRERLAAADPRAVIDAWPELTAWLARERALAGRGPGTGP